MAETQKKQKNKTKTKKSRRKKGGVNVFKNDLN